MSRDLDREMSDAGIKVFSLKRRPMEICSDIMPPL